MRQRLDLRTERFQCSLTPLLRGLLQRGIASVVRERQHLGKECRVLAWRKTLRQQGIELVELCLRGVVVRQSGGPFHLADDRIKRAVGVLRRAEITQAGVRLAGEVFQQRGREPRFADAGLAGEQHHLAFAGLGPRPAPQQQFEFFFSTDQLRQAARVERLEAALYRTRPQRCPGPHRSGDALEVLGPEVLQLEQITEKFSCAFGDDHAVRLGDPLQTRRQVRRLADDAALLRLSSSDQVADDNEPRGNADAGLQGSIRLEVGYRRNQLQRRANRPLGVVFMGLRIAEIHQHAIAHVFRHEPAEAANGVGDAFLIGRNDLAQVLRVHARRKCRRADQVREHHRDLAALGVGAWGGRRNLWRSGCLFTGSQRSNGPQQLEPRPKW